MTSTRLGVVVLVLAALAVPAPAAAHGDIQASDPAPRSSVRRPPRSVAITFTEAPTAQAVLTVTDGCRRDIVRSVDVTDATATVRVAGGEPGRWQVGYRVISSLDGHQTQGRYAFTVAGERDCTRDDRTDDPEPAPTQAQPPRDEEPSGSGAPVVPIALGAV
ncbi:MAG TPA: copper resistance CopC family protein, partial [Actinomycetota bacterium]|nr:copper resistance CopC family protein [Actinomycetota bacterium]